GRGGTLTGRRGLGHHRAGGALAPIAARRPSAEGGRREVAPMAMRGGARVGPLGAMAALGAILGSGIVSAAEGPAVRRHVVAYREPGRFAGWPANHGMWSWGDEVLVDFSRGAYKDRGPYHHIDH